MKTVAVIILEQFVASCSLHIQPIACVATPHTLPVNHAKLQN